MDWFASIGLQKDTSAESAIYRHAHSKRQRWILSPGVLARAVYSLGGNIVRFLFGSNRTKASIRLTSICYKNKGYGLVACIFRLCHHVKAKGARTPVSAGDRFEKEPKDFEIR